MNDLNHVAKIPAHPMRDQAASTLLSELVAHLREHRTDLRQEWAGDMSELTRQGWGHRTPRGFHLTTTGLRFADAAAELFLRP